MNDLKLQKLLLLLTLLGILALLIFTEITAPVAIGEIDRIAPGEKQTKIYLVSSEAIIILFDNLRTKLEAGQTIEVFGKEENYKDQKQIIANKIKLVGP